MCHGGDSLLLIHRCTADAIFSFYLGVKNVLFMRIVHSNGHKSLKKNILGSIYYA